VHKDRKADPFLAAGNSLSALLRHLTFPFSLGQVAESELCLERAKTSSQESGTTIEYGLIVERISAAIITGRQRPWHQIERPVFDHLVQVPLRRHKRATSPMDPVDGSSTRK